MKYDGAAEQMNTSILYNISFKKSIKLVDDNGRVEVIKGPGSLLEFKGGKYLMMALESGEIQMIAHYELRSIILDESSSDDK